MATYKQVGYGSQGSEVTELQKLLNSKGSYNLDTDGIFGDKTKAAVMDYQKRNNLDVDGIVGTNTWGALTQANATAAGPTSSAPAESTQAENKIPTFAYEAYKPSDTVAQAEALLQQQLMNKPGAYQSSWQGQLNEIIQNIQNRDKFSYNLNEDALYQQLKDQYVLLGQQASMDTMGQAATLTGGYGNSYAQSVGQQAYQGYLQQLNDKVPELYGMALDQYNREGQAMYDQAALMAQMEDQDYGRYRDQMSEYYTELDRLTNDSRYQAETDYGRYMDGYNMAYGQFVDDRNLTYQQERDLKADQQWQAQFDEAKRQYDQEYELALQRYADSKKVISDTPNNPQNPTKDTNYDAEVAKKQQELADAGYSIAVNGIWSEELDSMYEEYIAARGDVPTYDSIVSDLNTYIRNGANKSQISNFIRAAYKDGYISKKQFDDLKSNYVPRNYTY
jgi:peptidoglycan hydrolase-like protein with peptidoglycan-binding domain